MPSQYTEHENAPLVSVVIPVYNGSNYLKSAINSALSQTYRNIEVIVVNDGSKDEGQTEAICQSYGDSIRYFNKSNGGVASALNLGICEMRGEYFSWLAHDDMYYPHKIESQIKSLESSPDKTKIVHGNYDLLNVKYNKVFHLRQEDGYRTEQLANSVFPLLMTTVHASTPLIHKSHFERIGTFDENLRLTQDYDFLFRAMRGKQSIFLTEPLLLSRLHGESGKNTDNSFGLACSEQYKHFADSLTFEEVREMFPSPRAFYCRMAAMMKARADTPEVDSVLAKILELPKENESSKLDSYIKNCSGGRCKKVCIFGVGYYGKALKFELEHRQIKVDCFCDNDENKHGTAIDGTLSIPVRELIRAKSDTLIIIAADVSDEIEAQLKDKGFSHIITKKNLDTLILEAPPII